MRKNEREHDDAEGGANDKQRYDLSWILYLAPGYLSFWLKFQKNIAIKSSFIRKINGLISPNSINISPNLILKRIVKIV